MIIKDAWNTVKDKWEDIFGDNAERSNMQQLIGAIEVGEAMGYETCQSLFECSEDFFEVQQARITCNGAGIHTIQMDRINIYNIIVILSHEKSVMPNFFPVYCSFLFLSSNSNTS